jgi:hypothetical protein
MNGVTGILELESTFVLHNMSSRPRTPVRRRVDPVHQTWSVIRWTRPFGALETSKRDELDRFWSETGLTGAAFMYTPTPEISALKPVECTSEMLTLNIVLRLRGPLLLATSPLLLDGSHLDRVEYATDDQRIFDLVVLANREGTHE